jgi:hypothetical protein
MKTCELELDSALFKCPSLALRIHPECHGFAKSDCLIHPLAFRIIPNIDTLPFSVILVP